MTATRNNEGGGAYRWADEGGQQGGCPTSTSSKRGKEETEGVRHDLGGTTQLVVLIVFITFSLKWATFCIILH